MIAKNQDYALIITKEKIMNIQLKPEQEKFIQEKIASGEYTNADDVISEAFKLLELIRKENLKKP